MTIVKQVNQKEIPEENDAELLIRLIPITKGPLLKIRKEVRKSFIKAAISSNNTGAVIDVREISRKVFNIIKAKIDEQAIISVFNQLQDEGVVKHISGLKFELIKKIQLMSLIYIT